MFTQLNNLFYKEANPLVSFSIAEQADKHLLDFKKDINSVYQHIKQQPEQSWLLNATDSYHFAVAFLALCLAEREVIMSANVQSKWLASISDKYDGLLEQEALEELLTLRTMDSVKLPTFEHDASIKIFTSGSSGKPKMIQKKLSSLLIEVEQLEQHFSKELKDSVITASVSHQHIYGLLFRVLWPLLQNRGFSRETLDYQEQLSLVCNKYEKVTFVSSPAFLSRLDSQLDHLKLQACFSSGSRLNHPYALESQRILGKLPIEIFGSTETGGIGFRQQFSENEAWHKFSCVSFELDGEVASIRSPYLFDALAYSLDDCIELIGENKFNLLGRRDRVVKIAEKRVSLVQVEEVLNALEWIENANCLLISNAKNQLGCVAILSAQGNKALVEQGKATLVKTLKSQLGEHFDAVTIPKKWRFLEQLPYNQQGKLAVSSLLECFS